jgi:hypothetical protein
MLLAGVVALLLVAGGVGLWLIRPGQAHGLGGTAGQPTATATAGRPTPTAGPPAGPSGLPVVPAAAAIITNVQTASAVDGSYHPTQLTDTVAAGQTLYITFDLHLNGRTGYVLAKFYRDRAYLDQYTLTVDQPDSLNGYAYATYTEPVTNGAAELYWCQQASCSDAQLAAVAHFTITAASTSTPAAASAGTPGSTSFATPASPLASIRPTERSHTLNV